MKIKRNKGIEGEAHNPNGDRCRAVLDESLALARVLVERNLASHVVACASAPSCDPVVTFCGALTSRHTHRERVPTQVTGCTVVFVGDAAADSAPDAVIYSASLAQVRVRRHALGGLDEAGIVEGEPVDLVNLLIAQASKENEIIDQITDALRGDDVQTVVELAEELTGKRASCRTKKNKQPDEHTS
jgi:hypothetical protein